SITFDVFLKVDMRVGTILSVMPNEKARKPAFVLEIDFGDLGTRTSSAQIADLYTTESLVGRQVVAVVNFPPKFIAGVKSECLVLGATRDYGVVTLLRPDPQAVNGERIA